MEENKNIIENQSEESSIDFVAIWKAILKHRKLYYKVLPVTFIIMCIITLSLPNYYKCVVTLAPEMGKSSSGSGLAALASSFGVNLGGGGNAAGDAITPMLYPDLMNSVDFKTSLFDVKVQRKDDKAPMTYYDYLMNEQKRPWWSGFFGLMKREKAEEEPVNTFELTKEQEKLQSSIRFSAINVTPEGATAVGFTDNSNPKTPVHYYLKVGESRDGWNVVSADAKTATMTIVKGDVEVTLTLGGSTTGGPAGGKGGGPAGDGKGGLSGSKLLNTLHARRAARESKTEAELAKMRAERDAERAERARRDEEEAAKREEERAEQRKQLQAIQDELRRTREEKAAKEAEKQQQESEEGNANNDAG